jgi:hypothetical protein
LAGQYPTDSNGIFNLDLPIEKHRFMEMNKFKGISLFYIAAFAILYGLNKLSPGQPDGGLGFGGLSIILFMLLVIVLICFNLFKGIKHGREYFLLAGVHLLVLLVLISTLFL